MHRKKNGFLYFLIFETMFRKGWISHQKGDVLGNPVKQFQREKLKIHNSEFLSKRGLVFLKPQVHPRGEEARLLGPSLPGYPESSSRQALLRLPRGHGPKPRALGRGASSPWWVRPHMVMHTSWASYWLREGGACGSVTCHLRGLPLISLRKTNDTRLPSDSKLKTGFVFL